ncbi:MAG: 16S rRNA (cytosine(967)-C(5))-methyltransferase RsmB [Desulfomonilaceae bacterium]
MPPGSSLITVSRQIALEILNGVERGSFIETSLSDALSANQVSDQDRALITEIVYGTIRWKLRLDSIINRVLSDQRKPLNPQIRNILRMAIYQALFLSRVPIHSAVHQAVTQAKTVMDGKFSKLVNAILRSVLRHPEILYFEPAKAPEDLATYYSHPKWLVERWFEKFGTEKTIRILELNNQRTSLTLRVNSLKASIVNLIALFKEKEIDFEVLDYALGVLELRKFHGSVKDLPGFREGFFSFQDFASQMIAPLLLTKPGHRILDVCGAPGGKSSHIAALLNNDAEIILVDSSLSRLDETRQNFERLSVNCAKMIHADATQKFQFSALGKFDRVLVDAPCSNLGILRHNCEVKYRVRKRDLITLSNKQLKILEEASTTLGSEGLMIYCVCSISDEETFRVIDKFLMKNKTFAIDRIACNEAPNEDFVTSEGFFLSLPSEKFRPVDGFFAARMKKLSQ